MQHPDNLVWIDLEMTGLDSQRDHILEIATLITDAQLNILAEGPVIAIQQPAELLDNLDDWNRQHHGKSGLLERCRQSAVSTAAAEAATLAFIREYVPAKKSPLCGNKLLPLPQPRRLHPERAGAPLVSAAHLRQKQHASGACRHPGLHRRVAPLPRSHIPRITQSEKQNNKQKTS